MKIAVATTDGVSLSQHFGQSKGFVVFDVEGQAVQGRELRTNADTPHNQGICNHGDGKTQAGQGHVTLFDLLSDCSVVMCGGMGGGPAQALLAHGIRPALLPGEHSAEEAIAAFLNGEIPVDQDIFCNCKH